jgi:sec-independent protein translocase protein TatA
MSARRYNKPKIRKELKMENMTYVLAGIVGTQELVIILILALILFGRRLPETARNLGRSLNEFKKGLSEAKDEKDQVEKDIKSVGDDVSKEINKPAGK